MTKKKPKRRTWRSVIRACRLGKWASLASGKYNARTGEPGCSLCPASSIHTQINNSSYDCNFCPITRWGAGGLECTLTPYRLWTALMNRHGYNDPRTVAMARVEQAYLRAVEIATPANARVPEL